MDVTWLVIGVAILIAIIAVVALRRDDPFQATARGLSLNLTRSVPDLLPRIDGIINGLPVRIEIPEKTGPGVRYTVFYPALGMALKLQRETTITRTLGQLGETDTQVGARAFDDSFRVNTSRPDALRDMMNPQLRRTLVALIERYPKMVIADGEMTLATEELSPTSETMIETISAMAAAAHQLVDRRPPPLARPTPTAPATAPSPPVEAAPLPKSPPSAEPSVAQTPAPPEPEPTPPPPPTPVAVPAATGLPDGFFDDVFGANRLSFESSDTFGQELRGRRVSLSGTVKQARAQSADESDTGEPVTKATVTVAQIDNDLYGKTDIDAIVYLDPSAAAKLDRGNEVSFEGELDDVDAFMRNLFIRKARLVP